LDLKRALNAVLPEDVGVTEAADVPPGFDARRDVVRKQYRYRVLNRLAPSPLRRRFTWHIRRELDLEPMRRAAELLVGEHDFAAFRGAPGGPPPTESTVRKLERLSVEREGDEVRLTAEGRSFVRYMVRNLAGTLVEVGRGRLEPGEIEGILDSRSRARAGPTAPPRGLCLVRIVYLDEAG
jgi:tRNA pseudouridine38-40 synthase